MNPHDLFYYDESSPSGLRWKIGRKGTKGKDSVAGSCHKKHGAWAVQFRGTPTLTHRVVWEMFTGDVPNGVVTHKNGNKSDNSIGNLQLTDKDSVSKACQAFKDRGFSGVVYYSETSPSCLRFVDDFYSGYLQSVKTA